MVRKCMGQVPVACEGACPAMPAYAAVLLVFLWVHV